MDVSFYSFCGAVFGWCFSSYAGESYRVLYWKTFTPVFSCKPASCLKRHRFYSGFVLSGRGRHWRRKFKLDRK